MQSNRQASPTDSGYRRRWNRYPSADIGRAILERRFTASYRAIEFEPDYPSWPIKA